MMILIMSMVWQYGVAQDDENGSQNSLFYYSGTIGEVQKVEFNLQVTGLVITGSYILEKTGDLFLFNGRMNAEKSDMGIRIYNQNNVYIASMEASLFSDTDNFAKTIKGIWRSADLKEEFDVGLTKQAELAVVIEDEVINEAG
ncbi:hypothetical protein [Fulvivirga sp. M361]|uniref:hypothetical protein n=1 Tax=Fulvivirga sp. M361 TaxID=2594266 RepID=UPI00117B0175|nr:hypothetical protein [Fulvivirga sp. M361]